ncbi:ABC transporter ATP-binding protein [Beduini massiliensis]|uniref:ABC transporter ATP-binding protein n=1 Tax=Beduini massiliensis TaxID=1585974 RepID=UPI00059AABBE|nr:ABC transporter ATP-binding protein [Beduini massiliensis]
MNNLYILKKYFKLVKIKKRYTFYLIVTSLFADGPYMFTSLLFSYAIKYLTEQKMDTVIFIFILYFGLKILSKVSRIANYQAAKFYYNASYMTLQSQVLDKVNDLEYDYFTNEKKSHLINTVNTDIKELADFGTWLSRSLFLVISFLVSIIILWQINFGLMIFGVVVNGIVIYLLNHYNDYYEKIMFKAKQQTDKEVGFFSQIMNGMSEIKIFHLLSQFKQMYHHYNKDYLYEHDRMINNNIIKNIVSPAITMLAEILLMGYAVYNCLKGRFGIETVLIIQSYFGNMFGSLSELVTILGELRLKNVSIDRYAQFIEEVVPFQKNQDCQLVNLKGEVTLDDVTFSYRDQPNLSHLNLHFKPGKITGLVGSSGSGKSTIMKLILGFIQPDFGTVKIDDRDLSGISRSTLSQVVTMVNQDPFIFNLSIYDNFALINPDRNKIEEVCKKVHLYEDIMALPQQFETILNENATDLSGGQKQRLAIARALLKNTKIILFDEITSALDEHLSADILSFLKEIKQDHTIIMITHRSKEYQLCDEIIDLNTLSI